ncbi:MAG: peptidyl-tRNA hydrolase Pth2 [archaeon]
MYKQAIVVRVDLGMSTGKLAAQSAHASLESAMKVVKHDSLFKTDIFNSWRKEGGKKVVLKVESESALKKIEAECVKNGLKSALIKDAGLTEIPAGSLTALGIGPDDEKRIDKVTGNLNSL